MPIRWKIFRIALIVQTALLIYVLSKLVFSILKTFQTIKIFTGDPFFTVLIFTLLLSAIIFCMFCFYLLEKKYPEGEISKRELLSFKILNSIYTVITVIFALLIIFLLLEILSKIGIKNDINRENPEQNLIAIIIVTFMIYTSYNSAKLKNSIVSNFKALEKTSIDSIGTI
jgi:hypothetical protein